MSVTGLNHPLATSGAVGENFAPRVRVIQVSQHGLRGPTPHNKRSLVAALPIAKNMLTFAHAYSFGFTGWMLMVVSV